MTRMSILALPLLLAGCITYNIENDGIARARIDESVRVDGPTVTPLKVVEDSRCPVGMQCAWAGTVRITVRVGQQADPVILQLGQAAPVADGQLTLVEVYPAKRADTVTYPEEYRFGFRFAGGI